MNQMLELSKREEELREKLHDLAENAVSIIAAQFLDDPRPTMQNAIVSKITQTNWAEENQNLFLRIFLIRSELLERDLIKQIAKDESQENEEAKLLEMTEPEPEEIEPEETEKQKFNRLLKEDEEISRENIERMVDG